METNFYAVIEDLSHYGKTAVAKSGRDTLLHVCYHKSFVPKVPLHKVLKDTTFCDVPQCHEEVHLLTIPRMDDETITHYLKSQDHKLTNFCTQSTISESCMFMSAFTGEPWCEYHSSRNIVCEGQWCPSRFMSYTSEEDITAYFDELKITPVPLTSVPDPYGFPGASDDYESEEEDDGPFTREWFAEQSKIIRKELGYDDVPNTPEPTVVKHVDEITSVVVDNVDETTQDSGFSEETQCTKDFCEPVPESKPHFRLHRPGLSLDHVKSARVDVACYRSDQRRYRTESKNAGPEVTDASLNPPLTGKRKLHLATRRTVASVFVEEVSEPRVVIEKTYSVVRPHTFPLDTG